MNKCSDCEPDGRALVAHGGFEMRAGRRLLPGFGSAVYLSISADAVMSEAPRRRSWQWIRSWNGGLPRNGPGDRGDAQLSRNDTGEKILTEAGPGGTADKRGGSTDPRRVIIHNGRPHAGEFVLDREGFRFIRHDTKVGEFYNEDEIRRVYYPEMEALVKAESGASRVVVFDHTLRTGDDALRDERKIREVVPRVHNDYTEWSGPQRVRDLLPDEAEALLRRRFAIIQVWRPIRLPVESFPLAICDARTVSTDNLIDFRAALSQSGRPDLRHHLQSEQQMVLVSAHAARRGDRVQGVRFTERRPRPLDRAHRVRRSDLAAQRASARKHRNPHAGVFLKPTLEKVHAGEGCTR